MGTKVGGAISLEARSSLALKFMEHFGVISARVAGEDTAGRSKIELMPVDELIDRCFAMADGFIDRAEQRNELRACAEENAKARLIYEESRQRKDAHQ